MNKKFNVSISVVMPVYNTKSYLREAIESILTQTFNDFELIIINDGSTDGSIDVIENYASLDKRIKVVSRENRGISATRNEGVSLSSGKYIAWMDSDDISTSERLAIQYSYMEKTPDVLAIGTGVRLIDPDSDDLCEWKMPETHDDIDDFHMQGKGGAITFPSSMIRRSAINAAGGFRKDIVAAEDMDLFLRLAEIGKIENIHPLLLLYRQHEKSISHTARSKVAENTELVLRAAYKRRGLEYKGVTILSSEQRLVDIYNKWAWWALSSGNLKTARKYAIRVMKHNPFNIENLRLLACVIRGR